MKNNFQPRKTINVDKINPFPISTFKQEDDGVLKLALFANSVALDCTGQTIRLDIKRPDAKLVTIEEGITITNKNEIDIILTNNVFLHPGKCECDIEIKDANGKVTTASFFITVGKKVTGSENVQGANVIGAIDACVKEYETWKDAVAEGKGAFINDNGTATTTVYSSAKTQSKFNEVESALENIQNKTSNYVTLENFGAKGDGVTDDSDAFIKAITYAVANKMNLALFGKTYFINSNINVPINQQGINIYGVTRESTQLLFGENGGLTFPKFYRINISDITFKGNSISVVPIVQINSLSHLSAFERCSFTGSSKLVNVLGSAYITFRECNFNSGGHTGTAQEYMLKVKGEYVTIDECYFDDFQRGVDNVGIYIDDMIMLDINGGDIANFTNGKAVLIKPTSSTACKNINFNHVRFMRNKYHVYFYCNYGITGVFFNNVKAVFEVNSVTNECFFSVSRDSGMTGVVRCVNGNIHLDGRITTDVPSTNNLVFSDSSRLMSRSKINVSSNLNNVYSYSLGSGAYIKPIDEFNSQRYVINTTNTDTVNITLTSKSPYQDINKPVNALVKVFNGNPTPFTTSLTNTYGGDLILTLKFSSVIATLYAELSYCVF